MYVCDCGWKGANLAYLLPARPLPEGALQGCCPICRTGFKGCVQFPSERDDDDAPVGAVYAAPPVRLGPRR